MLHLSEMSKTLHNTQIGVIETAPLNLLEELLLPTFHQENARKPYKERNPAFAAQCGEIK